MSYFHGGMEKMIISAMLIHETIQKSEHYLYTEDFFEAINQEHANV